MFRSAAVGVALFSIGLSAGSVAGYQYASSDFYQIETPKPQQTRSAIASKPGLSTPISISPVPSSNVRAEKPTNTETAPSTDDVVLIRKTVSPTPVAPAIQIATVTPEASPPENWSEQSDNSTVKISVPGTAQSTLRENPIVIKELTLDIQHALYRAGCHTVRFSSKWDHRTATAAARFVANRNALLPTGKPDVVLLGLLRTYKGGDCGKVCAPSSSGSCDDLTVAASRSTPRASAAASAQRPSVPRRSAVVRRTRATSRPRTTASRKPAKPSKKQLGWRQKIHFGVGSDG